MVRTWAAVLWAASTAAAYAEAPMAMADREKLLNDTGVYGTFASFKASESWWKLDPKTRKAAAVEVKAALRKHQDKVILDAYLLRGLSGHGDVLLRIHSTELADNQALLLDLMSTGLGRHLVNTHIFNGITKKANYVPAFPDELKNTLKTPPDAGPKPYVVVVPVRKDAEWWLQGQEERNAMMKEHTEGSVAFLKTVKRKLYHATGLSDLDFITYFETAKPDDFNNLIISLQKVKENRHNRQFGSPLLLGSVRTVDEIIDVLAR